MPIGDQDGAIFFADGLTVTRADGSTFKANRDLPEVVEGGTFGVPGEQVLGKPELRYETASAADLAKDDVLTVAGVQYRVRSVNQESDGLISVARLATA